MSERSFARDWTFVGPGSVALAAEAARLVRAHAGFGGGDDEPIGIVLGSGLGPLADEVEGAMAVSYADLPGFAASSAPGHAGRLVVGRLAGRSVALLQGRLHLYEGHDAAAVAHPIRVLHALGARTLLVSNACGGLNPLFSAGDLMLQTDFVNHTFAHALTGPSDGVGPRFPVLFDAYDAVYREIAQRCARRLDLPLREGVYLAIAGPAYATRAELRAYRAWGADAIGMSTVHEVTLARALGMRVLGLSLVTDMALPDAHAHATGDEVLAMAEAAGERFRALIRALLPEL